MTTSRRRRVLWVSSPVSSSFAGGERTVESLLNGLTNWEHAFLGGSGALFDLFRARNFESLKASAGLEPVNPRNVLLFPISVVWGLLHFLRHRRLFATADIVVSPTSFTEVFTVFPWLIGFQGKRPIFWAQSPRTPRSIRWSPLRFLLRAICRRCQPILVSEPQRREWQEQRLATPNALVVPIGSSVRELEARHRSGEEVTAGFLGRLHEEKGIETLLRALPRVSSSRRLRLRIAGDGPAGARLRELARELVPPSIVLEWLGHVRDIRGFLGELDLLVVPSRRESFGLVPIEAWERGVPVLTSDLDVFLEKKRTTNSNEQELVFRAGDASHLAERLNWFLDRLDEFRRPEHARALHAVVIENFSTDVMVRRYEAVFESVLAEKVGGRRQSPSEAAR